MHFRHISLRDWKCYAGKVDFEFPKPSSIRNVCLIGAENGFGKTAFFEAVVLGLFGRDGMPLLYRARFQISGANQNDQTYAQFLSSTEERDGVLNRAALAAGATSCSVELGFEDESGKPITLQRIWHFTSKGAFKLYDEEVLVYEGLERRAVGPRSNNASDRLDWFRDWISKTFVPYYLGWFFLFDGEMVKTFADQGMREQVRNGIEGLLGLPVLRDLATHLRDYARARAATGGPKDGTIDKVERDEEELANRLQSTVADIQAYETDIRGIESEREDLTRILHGLGSGTQASSQELYQRLEQRRADLRSAQDRLAAAMESELALALPGKELRMATATRLSQEQRREQWQAGRDQGDSRLDAYISAVSAALEIVDPKLSPGQIVAVLGEIKHAWDKLWNPPDQDTAPNYRHDALQGTERAEVLMRLSRVGSAGANLLQILHEITTHEAEIERLQDDVQRIETIGPGLDDKRIRLSELQAQLGPLNQRLGALKLQRDSIDGQLVHKRQELANLRQKISNAAPGQRRAARAEGIAQMLDAILQEAVPGEVTAVADAMTRAFRSISHKGLVHAVEIDASCSVRLLSKSGSDVTGLAASAGEQQIFSLALIQAVLRVSSRSFPVIIDTPLGRLDEKHRVALMKELAELPSQVILLSTNTEVVGSALAGIKGRVGASYLLRHSHQGDVGTTVVEKGYFEGAL